MCRQPRFPGADQPSVRRARRVAIAAQPLGAGFRLAREKVHCSPLIEKLFCDEPWRRSRGGAEPRALPLDGELAGLLRHRHDLDRRPGALAA